VLEDVRKWFGKYNKEALGAVEEISKALGVVGLQVALDLPILKRFFAVDRIDLRSFSRDPEVVGDVFQ
jgi:hypothetical protein